MQQAQSLSNEEARLFLLNRSVFDVVKITQCMELTDPRLLGWYLSLPPEDRKLIQEEGGLFHFLQKHPALEVIRQVVYVKRQVWQECRPHILPAMSSDLNKSRRPTYYCVSQCSNCGASISFNAAKCRFCNVPIKKRDETLNQSEKGKVLDLLPNSVKDELNLCNASANPGIRGAPGQLTGGQNSAEQALDPGMDLQESFQSACDGSPTAESPPCQQGELSSQTHPLCQLWEEAVQQGSTAVTVYKDPSAQASFSLDVELELHSQTPKGVLSVQEHDNSGGEDSVDIPDLAEEVLPEYYSFNSTGLDATCSSDCSESDVPTEGFTEPAGAEDLQSEAGSSSSLCCFEQCTSLDSTSSCSKYADWMDDDRLDAFANEDNSRCDPKNEEYHSVMEDEPPEGGAAWASFRTSPQKGGEEVKYVDKDSQVSAAVCEGNAVPASVDSMESISAAPCERCLAKDSQITLSQLVDISGDFRASYTSTRATEARPSVASRSSNTNPPCATQDNAANTDCSLPHSPGRDRDTQTLSIPTAEKYVITDVYMSDLDYFTEEFIKLKLVQDELKELKAKSASSEGSVRDGHCDSGGGCGCSERAVRAELRLLALQHAVCQQHCWRRHYTSPEGERCLLRTEAVPEGLQRVLKDLEDHYQDMKREILSGVPLDQLHPLSVDSQRIVSEAQYIPAQRGQSDGIPAANPRPGSIKHGSAATFLTMGHKPGGAKDLDSSEAWYDAEEEFAPTAHGVRGEGQEGAEEGGDGVISTGEKDEDCVLCVSDLPSDITQDELMSCFGKYKVSDVRITTFSNSTGCVSRVAIVTVSCPRSAAAAERELNRHAIRGRAIKVERIRRPPAAEAGTAPAPRAAPTANGTGSRGSKSSAAATAAKPLCGRLEKLVNVQDSPTPTGTCVPQHYATMGSFDTLMARLSERHPEVGRQRIVEALLELRAHHQGLLSGLPLKTIVEMTSALLTRPSTSSAV
ncbi:RNA-binding protein 44 [Megalops cyprinoides]|uniref:RNA-binding protein 44 n=1 Tax=Megalops cyprinoides TaxID=118141 RepID=UPI001863BE6E|nr:RNA-binding protein 44 [Megalops cyprinoides]